MFSSHPTLSTLCPRRVRLLHPIRGSCNAKPAPLIYTKILYQHLEGSTSTTPAPAATIPLPGEPH